MIEFAHPWFLVLIATLPALALPLRHSLADLTPHQRLACTMSRMAILLALALALAEPRFRVATRNLAVLFVVDDSASVSPTAQKTAHDFVGEALRTAPHSARAGVVGFAERAALWQRPAPNLRLSKKWPDTAHRDATDLGGALSFASAIFPAETAKRIVLLSDGQDTADRAAASAQTLAQNGIELFAVPLRNGSQPEVLLEKLDAPQRTRMNEPFDLVAVIGSNVATQATVKLYQNQFLAGKRDTALVPGENRVVFKNLSAAGALASFEAEVTAARDTLTENNRAQATISVRGQPRVLIVESEESKLQPLAAALRAEKIDVETRDAQGLPRSLEDLQQFDLFLLSDVPALRMSGAQMELYRSWVREFGGGFAMLGGENSFGVGGYYKTPVEQMLPVRMEHDDREETPTVAMLIVLDRSGSMAAPVAGQTKMSLADQGAAYALDVLQPKDLCGVIAVDTRVHNVVPLARLESKGLAQQRIMAVTAGGGGIYIYSSLVEAFQQLRDAKAKIKHVILFSDANDAEEKTAGEIPDGTPGIGSALDLATAMLANNITTSVVALGLASDKDADFLKEVAQRGNGRFYLTSDALTLPQIFSTETLRVAQSSLIEEPFGIVPLKRGAATEGIDWRQAPLLLGCNATKPKPTADILLATERGEPLLLTWRYGLGQTAAFTSDAKARWASEWLAWPGYGKFWTQLVRALMRKSDEANLQVNVSEQGEHVTLAIDATTPDGSFRNELPVAVDCLAPTGERKTRPAKQDAPGRYSATFDLPAQGTSLFSVNAGKEGGSYVFGHTRSYPREFLTRETNEPLLRELAEIGHGKFAPAPGEIFAAPKNATRPRHDLSPLLLSLALVLFPLDLWLRRRSWKR